MPVLAGLLTLATLGSTAFAAPSFSESGAKIPENTACGFRRYAVQ